MGTQSAGRAVTLQRPPVAVRHRRSTASLGDQRLRASSVRARPHCIVRRLANEALHLAQVCSSKRAKRANKHLASRTEDTPICRCPSALPVRALQLESSVLSANSQGHFLSDRTNFVLLVRTKPPSSQWLYPSGGVGRRLCGEPKAKLGYCVSSTSATCHKKECIDAACRLLARDAR